MTNNPAITATQINYYFLCHRKLWFFANKIEMEHNSDIVSMGKFISENTYKREQHEIRIDDVVLDLYDRKNKLIREIKKSDKMEETHFWQVRLYISILEANGIEGVRAEINYPTLRKKVDVEFSNEHRKQLEEIKKEIIGIVSNPSVPDVVNKPFCKKCAYYDLCYV